MKNTFGSLALSTALTLAAFTLGPLKASDAHALENKDIVVSIRPLHSLVANITKGVATPKLLVTGASSPHTYALKPSDAKALSDARFIFWVGPALESFMEKPLKSLPKNAKIVSFLPEAKHGKEEDHKGEHEDEHKSKHKGEHEDEHKSEHKDEHDEKKHKAEHKDEHEHHNHEGGVDPHVWLNPQDAKEIVEKAAAILIKADPANTAKYQANLKHTLDRLTHLDHELAEKLKNPPPIVVFHDAYAHMAERYKLNIVDVLLHNPELKPGARQVAKIRQKIKAAKASCIFSEPQFNPKIVSAIANNTAVKIGVLDPLGSALKAGPDQYFKLMHQLADNMASCR